MMAKVIPTHFMGYYFRSRLEARWAVFFEKLQLAWRYETEGFKLPTGWYLPDFLLQMWGADGAYWVEIKPTDPDEREAQLLHELAEATGQPAYLVSGEPWPGQFKWMVTEGRDAVVRENLIETGAGGMPEAWLLCDREHDLGFGVDPMDAFESARSARFEHGDRAGLPLGWEGIEIGPKDDAA